MKRSLTRLLGLLLLSGPVAAHGSNYQPPPPDPPTPWLGPGDTTPSGASGSGPAPVAPVGQPSPNAPGTAGPNIPGAPGASAGAPTSGGPLGDALDLSVWTWWWEFNKEPYLQVKAHVYAEGPASGAEGFFLGHGAQRSTPEGRRPTADQIRDRIVPTLVETLRNENANDVITACLVALARIGDDYPRADQIELQPIFKPFLASSSQEIAETAAVALGILGNESAALLLSDLVLDTDAGARLVKKESVATRTRAFAAYGLGLVGIQTEMVDVRRYVVHKLARAVEEDDTASPDLGVACVLSLGRIPLEWKGEIPDRSAQRVPAASREEQILFLLQVMRDKKRHRIVRANVPIALGTLLGADVPGTETPLRKQVVDELLERFDPRQRETREMRQSIAIALGLIGDNDGDPVDREIRDALRKVDDESNVRHFALISLARVGARPGRGQPIDSDQILADLLRKVARDGNDMARWAAIALALFDRGRTASGYDPSPEASLALREALRDAEAPLDVGALSIACGLLGDGEATSILLAKLETIDEDTARGFAAIGLGLLDARATVEDVRRVVDESTYRPHLLRESAIALGLLGDKDAAKLLTKKLGEARSLSAQASIAQALGRIGDRETVDPLIQMIRDESITERARAFAAVALGIVADQDALPWNTWLSVDTNYLAAPGTLYDGVGFGILNIL